MRSAAVFRVVALGENVTRGRALEAAALPLLGSESDIIFSLRSCRKSSKNAVQWKRGRINVRMRRGKGDATPRLYAVAPERAHSRHQKRTTAHLLILLSIIRLQLYSCWRAAE
jgi:hypothetical protein